jgi:DNA-binding PadR family transcriptional regulator
MVSKELVAASSRPVVLSVLAEGESYGYAIIHEVKKRSGGSLEYTDGMLYPVLHRLENEGLIHSRWGTSETGRKRKYYRISRDGNAALQTERNQWLRVHNTLANLWGIKPCPI